MINKKTALLAAIIASAVTFAFIQNDARGIAGRGLPMAAKSQDRLPQSDLELVKVNLSTVSVVKEHDVSKRLTVLTKSSD